MNKHDKFREWLKEREALKLSVLERDARLPYFMLTSFRSGKQLTIPEKYWPKLEEVIKVYGWKG
jgi:hypothetical protein